MGGAEATELNDLILSNPIRYFQFNGNNKILKIPYDQMDKIIDYFYEKCIENKIDCELIRK